MSQEIARLIPRDHLDRCPEALLSLLARLVESLVANRGGVTIVMEPKLSFFDSGELLTSIRCRNCKSELSIQWWQIAMEKSHETDFSNLSVQLPCCATTGSLESLDYVADAGFAFWAIEIHEPVQAEISSDILQKCEAVVKRSIKVIWARY